MNEMNTVLLLCFVEKLFNIESIFMGSKTIDHFIDPGSCVLIYWYR